MFVAWSGADDHLNLAWGSTGGGFAHHITYTDTTYLEGGNGLWTAPALACWRAASGPYSDIYRLWISFTGTDNKLYYGFFNGGPDGNSEGDNGKPINYHQTVPGETTKFSTALAVGPGGQLRIGWVGLTNRFLYFRVTENASTWFNQNHISSETASAGFGMVMWCNSTACFLWIAWPGTDNPHHINAGNFGLNSGAWTHSATTADFVSDNSELTLLRQGELNISYAGASPPSGLGNLNVDHSANGVNWLDEQATNSCVWGVGAAVDGANHMWLTWVDLNTEIWIGMYN